MRRNEHHINCYVTYELKAKEFNARDADQMNFYLSVRDINKPIGISEYETAILESLPDNFKGSLPTIEEIEQELQER